MSFQKNASYPMIARLLYYFLFEHQKIRENAF